MNLIEGELDEGAEWAGTCCTHFIESQGCRGANLFLGAGSLYDFEFSFARIV